MAVRETTELERGKRYRAPDSMAQIEVRASSDSERTCARTRVDEFRASSFIDEARGREELD